MVQLKVYKNPAMSQDEQFFLDLYETEPIKLTLSIEDITNAESTSAFSRTLRVPATANNNEFFKHAFLIDGVDYDVTVKKPAEILVNGSEFRSGHIRLEKIYVNEDGDQIDYEILFLGETRDFGSRLSDKSMCQLVIPDLVHTVSTPNIILSWNAQPGTNNGLVNGNVIYPLIDFGNDYPLTNAQSRIALEGSHIFTQQSAPLKPNRFKPMIRAKRLVDQIFEDAGYTYTSNFFDSNRFKKIYVSAFGNNAKVELENIITASTDLMTVQDETPQASGYLEFNDSIYDPGNNFMNNVYYEVPTAGVYEVYGEANATGWIENSDYTIQYQPHYIRIVHTDSNGVIIATYVGSGASAGSTSFVQDSFSANVGDRIYVEVVWPGGNVDFSEVYQRVFQIVAAPGQAMVTANLDCNYKQVDFIKDILTLFRLVMSPDRNNPKNFIIEPWVDYIQSGDIHDWSDKLVRNKDFVIEPLFSTQSQKIDFRFAEDADYINDFHKKQYAFEWGRLEFVANNDLLKGKRDIKVNFAPTPLGSIEHAPNQVGEAEEFILPLLHIHDQDTNGDISHKPMRPKTRILFYNGLQDLLYSGTQWYLEGAVNPQPKYPLVSPYEEWPPQVGTLQLNWLDDITYWQPTAFTNQITNTLFTTYWQSYISALYNKFARRITAYFTLNNVDLQNFSFDDTVFVDGVYYIPEKIIDAQIGERTEVQVQLIKALDYKPNWVNNQQLTGFSLQGIMSACAVQGPTSEGFIQVTTNGTPDFTWQLSTGQSGTYNALVGLAPYTFNIPNLPPGTYTVTVTDSLNRSNSGTVTIDPSTVQPVTSSVAIVDANCPQNNGQIIVTPSGGTGPYEVIWTDGYIGNVRTGLAAGNYSYYVEDSLGCQSVVIEVTIECVQTNYVYEYAQFTGKGCSTLTPQTDLIESVGPIQMGDVFTVNHKPGCFVIIQEVQGVAAGYPTAMYQDCETCKGITPPPASFVYKLYQYELDSCDEWVDTGFKIDSPLSLTIGSTIQINANSTGLDPEKCYRVGTQEILYPCTSNTCVNVAQIYTNCSACQGTDNLWYKVDPCDGIGTAEPILWTGAGTLNPGESIYMDGKCWTVAGPTTVAPSFSTSQVWNTCEECILANGSGSGLVSNKPPMTPAAFPYCALTHPFEIYNNFTNNPYDIFVGSYMYEDPALTIPWIGGGGWYSIGDASDPTTAVITVFIDSTGEILDSQYCL
jgi:hypothetical protein